MGSCGFVVDIQTNGLLVGLSFFSVRHVRNVHERLVAKPLSTEYVAFFPEGVGERLIERFFQAASQYSISEL